MACLQATQGSQAGLVGNLQGMWCDAVPALVHLEWQTGRQAIWQPPPASTAAAVQAWLQVLPNSCCILLFSLEVLHTSCSPFVSTQQGTVQCCSNDCP